MFSDPQTVTINTVDKTLAKVKPEANQSMYATADEAYKMRLSHQDAKNKRRRHMARIDERKVAADPITAENDYVTCGVYIVIDEPEYGFSDSEIAYLVDGLTDWLSAANIAKLLAGEH
jgi:hypothetical protein